MVRRAAALALLALGLGPLQAAGQQNPTAHGNVPTIRAVRANSAIVLDGRLDDEVWLRAPAAGTFTQKDPEEGKPSTERTDLRLAYDHAALYVGARLFDREPSRIVRQLARRDREAEADGFWVFLDPHHDHLTGASFSVSAAGVQGDSTIYNDSWQDNSWDAVWESAVNVDAEGWSVEMRIPFSQLRFSKSDQHTFGVNAMRYIQRKNERAWLVHVPKTESGLASRMAHLEGLDGISPQRTLELLPYVLSRAEYVAPATAGDPFNDGTRLFAGGGLDLKYRVSSSLTLDGTVNPDFGQVEVDPAVVNLTAFETFFEEKRPFFIEGANIFSNFGRSGANNFWGFNRSEPMLFYSRRIGRSPQGAAHGEFVDRPSSTTILGAAKLTGKTRTGWTLAALEAVTGREGAKTANGASREHADIEPLTNYFVGRISRDKGRGAVGVLMTAVNRDLRAPPLRSALASQAYVTGVDGHLFLDGKREWVINGSVAASHVRGSTDAMGRLQDASQRYYSRPDATHIDPDPAATSLGGWTGSVNLNRNSGVHQVNAAGWAVSPGFESGDAGFNFNADRAGSHVVYQWRNPKVNRFVRERFVAVAKWYTWNFAGERQRDGVHAFAQVQFKNYWSLFGGALYIRPGQDDRATRGGPSMRSTGARGGFFNLDSDSRKRVSGGLNAEVVTNAFDESSVSAGLTVRYRPSASLEISTGPSYQNNYQLAQYVGTFRDPVAAATYGSRYVFATLGQKEFSLQTRVNYILSPRMSLQVYMQPLVSVGDYRTFKELARPRTYDFTRFGEDLGTLSYDPAAREYHVEPGDGGAPFSFGNPDFNFKSLRLNAIFRWEWRPGSALYLVWTEQRQDLAHPGQFVLGRDVRGLFRAPADDVLLVKIAYWFQR